MKGLDAIEEIKQKFNHILKNNNDFEFDFEPTKKDLIYIDTIYNPLETRTLKFLKDKH